MNAIKMSLNTLSVKYMIEEILSDLETKISQQSDPATKSCLEEAYHHMKVAEGCLNAAIHDPQSHYDDAQAFYRILGKVLPLMVLLQTHEPLPHVDYGVESSVDTQSSDP